MYNLALILHNLVRWAVLIVAIVATVRAFIGWFGHREWTETDRKWGTFFTIAMDIQLLLGLLLYFVLSPITRQVFSNFGAAMSSPDVRFFGLEHAFYMIVAVVLAHVGSVLSRRAPDSLRKFRMAAIFFGLATLIILIAIPWFRPLIRL